MSHESLFLQKSIEYLQEECIKCGVLFCMTRACYDAARKDSSKNFYCTNGHPMVYGESEADRLRKELEAERKRKVEAWERANAAEQRAKKAERKLFRVGKGVCPWCKRSFQNLKKHVACKHPAQDERKDQSER